MKTFIKTSLILFLILSLFESCVSSNYIVLANKQLYYDEEAIVAYHFYNELYKNDVIEHKPIIIKKIKGNDIPVNTK